MKVRHKTKKHIFGESSKFNIHSLTEIIIGYKNEKDQFCDQDSDYIRDYEVYLTQKSEWKCMLQAFKDKDLIPDNYNTYFLEPPTEQDRERGFLL